MTTRLDILFQVESISLGATELPSDERFGDLWRPLPLICQDGLNRLKLQGQTVSLVMGDAPGGVVSGSPPLDWVMCGLAGPSGVEADGTSGTVAK